MNPKVGLRVLAYNDTPKVEVLNTSFEISFHFNFVAKPSPDQTFNFQATFPSTKILSKLA